MTTPTTGETAWPHPMVERLKELYADGLSHSAIGRVLTREFGRKVSRNASIGKAHRLGLPSRPRNWTRRPPKMKPEPMPEPEPEPEPEPLNIPMVRVRRKRKADSPRYYKIAEVTLTRHTCKWPVNDGGPFLFCGHPVAAGDGPPYCPVHRRRHGNGHGTGHRHTPETIAAMRRAAVRRRAS